MQPVAISIDILPTACRVMAKRLRDVCGLPESEPLWRAGRGFVVRDLPWTVEKLRGIRRGNKWRHCTSSSQKTKAKNLKVESRNSAPRVAPANRWRFFEPPRGGYSCLSWLAGQLFVVRNPPMIKTTRHINSTR